MARTVSRQMSLALATLVVLAAVLAFYSTRGPGGIGGTGITDPGGLGGTGIFGRIDRFGSIWVNDREIFYDDSLPVVLRGAEAAPDDFALGQMVAVVAEEEDGQWQAQSARIVNEAVGPIEAADETSLRVLGQQILFTEETIVAEELSAAIDLGAMVAVSGFRTASGAILATRIDAVGDHAELFVRGPAANISTDGFMVGDLEIVSEGHALADGDFVAARGALIGGAFTAYDLRTGGVFEGLGLENISYQGVAESDGDGASLRVGEYSAANISIVTSGREKGDYSLVVLEGRASPGSLTFDQEVRASAIEERYLAPAPGELRRLAEEEIIPDQGAEEIETPAPDANERAGERAAPVEEAPRDAAPAQVERIIEEPREEPAPVEPAEAESDITERAEPDARDEESARQPDPVDETVDAAADERTEESAGEVTRPDADDEAATPEQPASIPDEPQRVDETGDPVEVERVDAPETTDIERTDIDRPDLDRPEIDRPERPEVVRPERPERPQRPNR